MREMIIKGEVVQDGEEWYVKNGNTYHNAADLLISIDLLSMHNGNYMIAPGDEIEVTVKIKERDETIY